MKRTVVIRRCARLRKWRHKARNMIRCAARGIHPLTLILLQSLLPITLTAAGYIAGRYLFFEPHVLGVCHYYRGAFLYAMAAVCVVFGGAWLLEVALRIDGAKK